MVMIRKMIKDEEPMLFDIAVRAFRPGYERYGVYPPLLNIKKKKFLPPVLFGKVILENDVIVGGAFVVGSGKKREI